MSNTSTHNSPDPTPTPGKVTKLKPNGIDGHEAEPGEHEADAAEGGNIPLPPPPDNDTASAAPDPFDPGRFRIRQDFAATAASEIEAVEIAIAKPNKQEFIRVHPSAEFRLDAAIIEYDRATYLVVPGLADGALRNQVTAVTLFVVQNTQKVTYLWPVALPKDGKFNTWTDSARELAARAMVQTIQVQANHSQKASRYDAVVPLGRPPEPEWPDLPFAKLLRLAFGDKVIDTIEHPVARRLLGITFD
jgi:hypothetical protein